MMAPDKQTRKWQTRFAVLWLFLTVIIIIWFIDLSWWWKSSDFEYVDKRLNIIQRIVMISGVSFSLIFMALE